VSAVAGAGPPQCAPGEQTARVLAAATESVPPTYIYRPICSDADFTLVGKGDQLQARPVNAADRMFMYLDTPVEEGHRWQDSVGRSLSWHKAGSVTVPAGTYHDCWERRLASATENGAVTFCRGVGQVRYSMSSYSAELRSKSF